MRGTLHRGHDNGLGADHPYPTICRKIYATLIRTCCDRCAFSMARTRLVNEHVKPLIQTDKTTGNIYCWQIRAIKKLLCCELAPGKTTYHSPTGNDKGGAWTNPHIFFLHYRSYLRIYEWVKWIMSCGL